MNLNVFCLASQPANPLLFIVPVHTGHLKESTRQFPPNDTRDNDDVICDRQETQFCATAGIERYTVELQWLEHLWDHEN